MKQAIQAIFQSKEKRQAIRSYITIIGAILAVVKQVVESTFGIAIPSNAIDAWVDLLSWAVILYAGYRNNYIFKKGFSQLKLLKNSDLE